MTSDHTHAPASEPLAGPAPELRHVQMYDVARTAHFERALRSGVRTTILFEMKRYDFDEKLAAAVGARRVGVWGAFWYTLRHPIDVLEIAEPLVARAAPRTLAAILGARLRGLLRRTRVRVVAYAIENKDPWDGHETLPAHAQIRLRAQLALTPAVWRSLDRIAYGTSQSSELYGRKFRSARRRPEEAVIPALPVAEPVPDVARPAVVTFLGEFSERKGFDQVRAAWPAVARRHPDAELVLMGKGSGTPAAEEFAAGTASARTIIDPPRDRLFAQLESTKVLILPSQPRPRWREQVGLPIVEGLARGCVIVTTSETGLAPWLQENGHYVVARPHDTDALAEALSQALDDGRTAAQVTADLPDVDGRAEAERWMLIPPVRGRG